VLGEITPENTNLYERKVLPFSIMISEKFSPSFTFVRERTILKVKYKLQALCILNDDGLYKAKTELIGCQLNQYYDR